MVKLSNVDRARAIGHLEAGLKQRDVAVLFGVSPSTIPNCGSASDTGIHDVRTRITTDRVDRSIRLATLRNRCITARSLHMRYLGHHDRRVSIDHQERSTGDMLPSGNLGKWTRSLSY